MTLARLLSVIRSARYLRYVGSAASEMRGKQSRNYLDAITTLNSLQTNAQYIKQASKDSIRSTNLQDVTRFLARTGVTLEQLEALPIIHVTGTNGKGTTCAYTESILRRHGYKTGFYSSPHLLDVRERIRINGKPVSKDLFLVHFWKIYDKLFEQKEHPDDMPLYFRYLTILAFHIFLEANVDVAILEVGIGGELDCTNVVRKTTIAAITSLDLDHTALLGNNLESIAWNKSGIMKKGSIFLCTDYPENINQIFKKRSIERECKIQVVNTYYDGQLNSKIPEQCQRNNAGLAMSISETFMKKDVNNNKGFSSELARDCIENTKWYGRYEIIQQKNLTFFLDGAHTSESIKICRNWFMSNNSGSRKTCLIFNLTGERDPNIFFKELGTCGFNLIIFSPNIGSLDGQDSIDNKDLISPSERQIKRCQENKEKWLELHKTADEKDVIVSTSFEQAVQEVRARNSYDVLVTGSIHLIGAALSILNPTLDGTLID